jgi:hypothetical protein
MEGDEMVTDDPDGEGFRLDPGYCWVLADNEALPASEALDSRSYGPLPLKNVLGRVMYRSQSETDHGVVDNSEQAQIADEAILEGELHKLTDS